MVPIQNDCIALYKHRDAGTRKGPGGQTFLKGTDKILIMLQPNYAKRSYLKFQTHLEFS